MAGVDMSASLPGLLKARGWTQERLAAEAGISRTDINAMANGRLLVGRVRLARIAAALDVSPVELGQAEADADDERGRSVLGRQEELEAEVARLARDLRRLAGRVSVLERQARPGSGSRKTNA